MSNIVLMQESDVETIAKFMAESFSEDPLYAYFVPDLEKRMQFMEGFFAFRLRYAMHLGKVFTTGDRKAVAAWIPPDVHLLPEHMAMFGGEKPMMIAGEEAIGRIMGFSNFCDVIEKEHAPMPHWHLSPIVVDRAYWGKGYAKQLIQSMLAYFDEQKQFCYLETQTEKNRNIYQKYGFNVVKEDLLPNSAIPHYVMLRQPQ